MGVARIERRRRGWLTLACFGLVQAALASVALGAEVRPATSAGWSGYTVYTAGVSGARADWVAPGIEGPPGAHLALWVGVGGWGTAAQNRNIAQIGTLASVLPDGEVQQRVWYEFAPPDRWTVTKVSVREGDDISAAVVQVGPSRWKLWLKDESSGRAYTTTRRFHSLESSGEAVIEDPESDPRYRQRFPFPSAFTPVSFSGAEVRVDGEWSALEALDVESIALVQNGLELASAGRLEGDGFTVAHA